MPLLALFSEGMVAAGAAIAILFVAATYAFITYDRGRAGSKNKDDTQVGLKLVLFALIIVAISLLAEGVRELLAFVLGGFKGGSMPVRAALPAIFVGGGAIALILKVLLPRTNMNEYTQAARFTVGVLALQFGVMALIAVYGFLLAMFTNVGGWAGTSSALASAFVSVAFAFPALRSFGGMSGWVEPPRLAPPGYPPAGYGPPQGGGFPPQGGYGPGSGPVGQPGGGGYGGPPSGGMPPQGGGGMPPQGGGGYGPPGGGGGYGPPGGGGGYGPPGGGGGGYPPR